MIKKFAFKSRQALYMSNFFIIKESTDQNIGRLLKNGRYEIKALIGSGGHGKVYLAHDKVAKVE